MPIHSPSHVVLLTVISGRKRKNALIEALAHAGGRLIHVVYGRGSVSADYLHAMLGLVPEENKGIITCLIPRSQVDAVLEMLVTQFHFENPNTGIAFTMPIEDTSL